LGRFCNHLDGKNHKKTVENVDSRENRYFSQDKVSRSRLGPNLADFCSQNGSKMTLLGTLLPSQNPTQQQPKKRRKKRAKKPPT